MKRIKKIINNIILCIRFPFLYTRNRFSGLHYNNYTILKLIDKIKEKNQFACNITVNKTVNDFNDPDAEKFTISTIPFKDKFIRLSHKNNDIILHYGKKVFYVFRYENIKKVEFIVIHKPIITLFQTPKINSRYVLNIQTIDGNAKKIPLKEQFIVIKFSKFYIFAEKLLKWFHDNFLQVIFCVPTSTELDSMPKGWRKAFGIQMCKEIKKELKQHHYLYKYRIMQIKEKFGTLRWYDNGSPNGCVYEIIDKYEDISYHTCINCGSPATKISKGWISPYCDNCIGDRKYTNI